VFLVAFLAGGKVWDGGGEAVLCLVEDGFCFGADGHGGPFSNVLDQGAEIAGFCLQRRLCRLCDLVEVFQAALPGVAEVHEVAGCEQLLAVIDGHEDAREAGEEGGDVGDAVGTDSEFFKWRASFGVKEAVPGPCYFGLSSLLYLGVFGVEIGTDSVFVGLDGCYCS